MADRPAVLITGAARRLGAAMARRFGEAGWHVVIHHAHSQDEAGALAATLPSAETYACDLADPDAAAAMIADCAARLADWRALVNNASVFEADDPRALDRAIAQRAYAVNALAPVVLAQTFLASARAKARRSVIMVTDQKVANPNPDFFAYTLAKHALAASVPMLAMSWPDERIYSLAPGAILASHDQDEAEAERSHRRNLLGRRTGADEIADAALFLAQGHLASGQTLFVDSGQHLMRQPRDVIYLERGAA